MRDLRKKQKRRNETMLFRLGRTVITKSISDVIEATPRFLDEINFALARYVNGDWGELPEGDANSNDFAIKSSQPERVFATYDTTQGKIWIITEWDRSYTTILFPSDY